MSSVYDGEVFPPRFTVLRRDHPNDAGWGGVLLAVRNQYKVQHISDIDGYSSDIELVTAIVTLRCKKVLCCVVYVPSGANDDKYLNTFVVLENIVGKYPKMDVLIVGDFNLNIYTSQNVNLHYYCMLTYCKLKQFSEVHNKHGNMLDLVLSNLSGECVSVCGDGNPVVKADGHHPTLRVGLKVPWSPPGGGGAARASVG